MTPSGNLELCFVHIEKLMTNPAVYRLPCSYVRSLLAYCRGYLRVKRLIYQVMMDYKTF